MKQCLEDASSTQPAEILRVENLVVTFDTDSGPVTVLDDVSFSVTKGQTIGIVGESGCGKSVFCWSWSNDHVP